MWVSICIELRFKIFEQFNCCFKNFENLHKFEFLENDGRFHDLRRTFGYNLIKQGRPIYEVSKLLGHSSVTTTERHYAPLMATEIDEFQMIP